MYKLLLSLTLTASLFIGCSEELKEEKKVPSGMKCGAGKCGASMFDGNSVLEKKKKNILSQMKEDDSRKDCVINAKTTKDVYNCVRDPKGNTLTTKCGDEMKEPQPTPKKEPAMKCGEGKCGSSM